MGGANDPPDEINQPLDDLIIGLARQSFILDLSIGVVVNLDESCAVCRAFPCLGKRQAGDVGEGAVSGFADLDYFHEVLSVLMTDIWIKSVL